MATLNIVFTVCMLFITLPLYSYGSDNITDQNTNVTKSKVGDPCERTPSMRNQLFIVLMVCIFIVGMVGNTVAILVILLSRRIRSQQTNIFVASLAVCDIGVCLFTIPIRLDTYINNKNFCFNTAVCKYFNMTDLVFHISSISHLFAIAIERYIAVSSPFVYQRIMTRTVTVLCIAFTWVYSSVWTSVSVFDWNDVTKRTMRVQHYVSINTRLCLLTNPIYYTVVYSVVYIIPLSIMAVLYALILRIALKQARTIASLSPAYLRDSGTSKKRRQEVSATKTLAIVYGAFVVCWLPVAIITISSNWCPNCFRRFRTNNRVAFEVIFTLFIEILPAVNSCLNPFLYILFYKKFRQALKILVYRFFNSPINFINSHSDDSVANTVTTNNRTVKSDITDDLNSRTNNTEQFYELQYNITDTTSPSNSSSTNL